MIENTTNLIREKNNIAEMKKCHFKMNLDAQERLPRNGIFNLKTNRSQFFFPFQAGVFLVLGSSSWVICKYITLLFPFPLSPVYPISISEWQNLNDKANSIALYRKLILVSLKSTFVLGHTRKRKVILAVASALYYGYSTGGSQYGQQSRKLDWLVFS